MGFSVMSNPIEPVTFECLRDQLSRLPDWQLAERVLPDVCDGPSVLCAHRSAKSAGSPRILVSAGVHGDEPAGTLALLEALNRGDFSDAFEWLIFPALNPTGLLRGTRENAEGIDLNRDFKTRRAAETRFYIEQVAVCAKIDLHLSLHEDWEYDKAYLYELNSSGRASIAREVLEVVDQCMGLVEAAIIDGHCPTARGFIRHELVPDEPEGWPEAIYLTQRFQVLSYTLETPSRGLLARRVECFRKFLQTAPEAFLRS